LGGRNKEIKAKKKLERQRRSEKLNKGEKKAEHEKKAEQSLLRRKTVADEVLKSYGDGSDSGEQDVASKERQIPK
jgi:hypothetical protein